MKEFLIKFKFSFKIKYNIIFLPTKYKNIVHTGFLERVYH